MNIHTSIESLQYVVVTAYIVLETCGTSEIAVRKNVLRPLGQFQTYRFLGYQIVVQIPRVRRLNDRLPRFFR